MSETKTTKIRWRRVLMWVVLLFQAAFFTLATLFVFPEFQVVIEFFYHLAFGWIPFLSGNLPKMSWNADVWAPGLGAFLVSAAFLHFIGRKRARTKTRKWKLSQTLALAAVLPLLFGVSFLIPGALLQVKRLATGGPIVGSRYGKDMVIGLLTREAGAELRGHLAKHGYLPESLPPELTHDMEFIYLGGINWDESSPVLISPAFSARSGRRERILVNAEFQMETIPAEDAELWITRAIDARR